MIKYSWFLYMYIDQCKGSLHFGSYCSVYIIDGIHCGVECKAYISGSKSDGALDRGSPCHLSILRNANVACLCRLFMLFTSLSHVTKPYVACRI